MTTWYCQSKFGHICKEFPGFIPGKKIVIFLPHFGEGKVRFSALPPGWEISLLLSALGKESWTRNQGGHPPATVVWLPDLWSHPGSRGRTAANSPDQITPLLPSQLPTEFGVKPTSFLVSLNVWSLAFLTSFPSSLCSGTLLHAHQPIPHVICGLQDLQSVGSVWLPPLSLAPCSLSQAFSAFRLPSNHIHLALHSVFCFVAGFYQALNLSWLFTCLRFNCLSSCKKQEPFLYS